MSEPIEIPAWDYCDKKSNADCPLTKLEQFVYDWQPNNPIDAEEWRHEIKALLQETRHEQ